MVDALRRFAWPLTAFTVAAAATVLCSTSHGLWDPLELDLLDSARSGTEAFPRPPLGPSSSVTFQSLLEHMHGAGRLPIALFGLATAVATFGLTRLATDARGASYGVLLLVGAPILVLNSRLVVGASPVVLAQTLVALAGFAALTADLADRRRLALAAGAFLLGTLVSAFGAGLLLGVMPGLLAAAITAWLAPVQVSSWTRYGLTALALACGVYVGFDVLRDAATYRFTLGGAARGDEPPAFHHAVEVAFHGLGPLAALAPLGAAWYFVDRREGRPELLARFALLWLALAYGAAVLFEARYGTTTFAAAPALAVLVAVVLRERDDLTEGSRFAALVVALFVGLAVRDALLFPAAAFDSLPVTALSIPDDVDLRPFHAAGALVFLAVTVPVLVVRLDGSLRSFAAPYRAVRDHFVRSRKGKLQIIGAGAMFVIMVILGVFGAVAPDALPMRSVIARGLGLVALAISAIPFVVAAAQLALRGARRLGRVRHGSVALAAGAWGLIFAFGTLPTLSRAFSPREVFDLLARHRTESEALVVLETAERAAHHYAAEPIVRAASAEYLASALDGDRRVWGLVPKSKLADVDRAFRAKHGEHVFVVDDGNPLAYLITSQALAGAASRNPLERFVVGTPVTPKHPVRAKLKGGYELVGYELVDVPAAIHPGERFTLRLVWFAERRGTRSYEVFVHLDGPGGRVHGDHKPVDGLYPSNTWNAGDYVIDEVKMRIPAHYAPGTYTLHVGLFQGSHRAEVIEGKKDNDNRIVAGTLEVR
jgi:hypothetical protein